MYFKVPGVRDPLSADTAVFHEFTSKCRLGLQGVEQRGRATTRTAFKKLHSLHNRNGLLGCFLGFARLLLKNGGQSRASPIRNMSQQRLHVMKLFATSSANGHAINTKELTRQRGHVHWRSFLDVRMFA